MNKITRKLLPYRLVIALLVITTIGIVGINANASVLSDNILDRVADKIAEKLLGDLDTSSIDSDEEMLGWSTKDEIWLNNDSGVIYLGKDQDVGIRIASGVLQGKNTTAGGWSALGAATPGDEGWLAYEPVMTPATNEQGYRYALIIGGSETATSSITGTSADTVLAVDGQMVVTGAATITGALTQTGNATLAGTLAVTGTSALTGNVTMSGTLAVTGTTALTGAVTTTAGLTVGTTLAVTGNSTFTGNILQAVTGSIDSATAGALNIGTSTATSIEISDTGVTTNIQGPLTAAETVTITGATSLAAITGTGNWLTTGNISGANGTLSGSLTVDTNSLYVDNSGNAVGIGTTTPNITGASLAVYDEIEIFDATSPYDILHELLDSSDDAVYNQYADGTITNVFHANGVSYITGGALGIGTTTPVNKLVVLDGTNAQLQLSYDADNSTLFTTGSGGDITVAPSGGDLALTGTLTTSVSVLIGAGGAVDTSAAGALSIGTSTATSIEIADTGVTTNIQGPLTAAETVVITGTLGVTGVATLTTDLVVDTTTFVVDASANSIGVGTTTPASLIEAVAATGTSTLTMTATAAGSGGRIILEDSDGAGCSEIYILDGTVISATVTCPNN